MYVRKAEAYLKEVLQHKKCIPFTRYNKSMGRTGQALQAGFTKGRWPEKSIRVVLDLLKNAIANGESKKLNIEKLAVKKIIVNQAVKGRRRTYRAHGRINAYLSSNCHVEIICEEAVEAVKKAKKTNEEKPAQKKFVFAKRIIRKSLAKAYRKKNFVSVGKKDK